MPTELANLFYNTLRAENTRRYYGVDNFDRNITDLMGWLEVHSSSCEYFNGFSIARHHRNRDEDVIIKCSCGESHSVSPGLWHIRIQNMDIEDIIEDLNYQHRDRSFNIKERFKHSVEVKLLEIKSFEEAQAKWKHQQNQEKKGTNAILGLEV